MKRRCDSSARVAGIGNSIVLALTCMLSSPGVRAEPPGEVTGLLWCAGAKNCLEWSITPDAAGYRLYRGSDADLAALLDASTDSCVVGDFGTTTTGPILDEALPEGATHWFLVTAQNADGEGGGGQSSAGARVIDGSGACDAVADLVINEVDYDQPGIDTSEFVEIHNARATAQDLAGLVLILVNGQTMEEYRRYELSQAGASLAAGGYLVVGATNVVTSLPPGALSVAFASASNNLQNGAPDAVALFDSANLTLIDALSYEGSITAASFVDAPGTFDLVHGTAATVADSNSLEGSLSRSPNGSSSGDDDSDWIFNGNRSPGSANPAP